MKGAGTRTCSEALGGLAMRPSLGPAVGVRGARTVARFGSLNIGDNALEEAWPISRVRTR